MENEEGNRALESVETEDEMRIMVNEKPFGIAVVTPLMDRVGRLPTAARMAFVETKPGDDHANAVTIFLVDTQVGPLFVGVVITAGLSEVDDYVAGFQLLRRTLSPDAFGCQGYPDVFKHGKECALVEIALQTAWPQSDHNSTAWNHRRQAWKWMSKEMDRLATADDRAILLDEIRALGHGFTARILDVAVMRRLTERVRVADRFLAMADYAVRTDVTKLDDTSYLVLSSTRERQYIVDVECGTCECSEGREGPYGASDGFIFNNADNWCKHAAAVLKFEDVSSWMLPVVTERQRADLAQLAGWKSPAMEWPNHIPAPELSAAQSSQFHQGLLFDDKSEEVGGQVLMEDDEEEVMDVNEVMGPRRRELLRMCLHKKGRQGEKTAALAREFCRRLSDVHSATDMASFLRGLGLELEETSPAPHKKPRLAAAKSTVQ